jgi:hypothetical protein
MNSERKIILKIDVKDEEVKQATSSMNRLEKAAKEVGTSGKDIKQIETSLSGVASGADLAASAFNPFTFILSAITAEITLLTTGLITATKLALDLAQSFASYGAEIGKAQQITGLTAETLSALRIEAENADSSFESIVDSLTQYSSKIADAAKGSKEAQKELNSLGIDGKKYLNNFEGAVQAAFKSLNELPVGIARSSAATKLFGEEGARVLLPMIAKSNGDIQNLIKTLEEFGLILSQEDVQSSREFNKAMGEVQMEIRGVGLTLGRDLLPVARDVFRSLSGFYKENKTEIKEWSIYIADLFQGALNGMTSLIGFIKENWAYISGAGNVLFGMARSGLSKASFGLSDYVIDAATGAFKLASESGQNTRDQRTAGNSLVWQSWDSSKAANANKYFTPDAEKVKREDTSKVWTAASLAEFTKNLGYKPGSGFVSGGHNQKSLHYDNRALDVGLNTNPQLRATDAYVAFMETALKAGIRVVDERIRPKPGAVWTAPHLHIEENDKRASFFNPKLDFGGKLEYLKALDAERLSGNGKSVASALAEGYKQFVEADNKQFQEERFNSINEFFKKFGMTPNGDYIKQYTDFLNKDIELDRNKLNPFDVKKQFEGIKQLGASGISNEIQPIGIHDTFRNTLGDDYLKALKEALNVTSKTEEVMARNEKHQQIVVELLKDAYATQELTLQNLSEQYEVQMSLFNDPNYRKGEEDIQILQEKMSLQRDIFDLETQINIQAGGYNDSLKISRAHLEDVLDLRNRELDAVIEINRVTLEMSQANVFSSAQTKAKVLSEIQSNVGTINDALADGIISAFEKGVNYLDERLGKIGDIPILGDLLKFGNRQLMSSITTNLMDAFLPPDLAEKFKDSQMTVSDKITESNKYLKRIADAVTPNVGGIPVLGGIGGGGGAGGFGGFGNFALQALGYGGNLGNRNGINSPYIYNANGNPLYTVADDGYFGASGGYGSRNPQINILSLLNKKIFGDAGFGFKTKAQAAGTISGIGSLASLAGGFVPGVGGSVLSGVGSGIGAASALSSILGISAIGGPVGLAIGGAIGGVVGLFSWLFGKSKKEKADREQMPKLTQSFTDALTQMRELVDQAKSVNVGNALNFDSESITQKASELRAQIASGFGVQMQSKKYQKESASLISANLRTFDGLNTELNTYLALLPALKEQASAGAEREQRMIAEFATGGMTDKNFMLQYGQFKRQYGLLKGGIPGVDSIPVWAMQDEMFLTKKHQRDIINGAGYDVFAAHTKIPNYPVKMETGGYLGNVPSFSSFKSPGLSSKNIHLTLNLPLQINEKSDEDEIIEIILDALDSDEMRTKVVEAYNKGKTRGSN